MKLAYAGAASLATGNPAPLVGAAVGGVKKFFASSDAQKDANRCDTAKNALAAALAGARTFLEHDGTPQGDPVAWIVQQKDHSASAVGKQCYRQAYAALQNAGVVGVAVPTGNGASIAPNNPSGMYREKAVGSMTPGANGDVAATTQAGFGSWWAVILIGSLAVGAVVASKDN